MRPKIPLDTLRHQIDTFFSIRIDAQKYEKEYWKQNKEIILSENYRNNKRIGALKIFNEMRITTVDGCLNTLLEVGGAADPMVEYFNGDFGIVIDPLAFFYKQNILNRK